MLFLHDIRLIIVKSSKNPTIPFYLEIVGFFMPVICFFAFHRSCDLGKQPGDTPQAAGPPFGLFAEFSPRNKFFHLRTSILLKLVFTG